MKLEHPYTLTWAVGSTGKVVDETVADSGEVIPMLTSLHNVRIPIVVSLFRYLKPGSTSIEDAAGCIISLGADRVSLLSLRFGVASDPNLEPLGDDLIFSCAGEPTAYHPSETRLTPQQAFDLAAELVLEPETPPSFVEWLP